MLTFSKEYLAGMSPTKNEALGNLGGNAYVHQVIDKTTVIASIPALGWKFQTTVSRGTDGKLMSVK